MDLQGGVFGTREIRCKIEGISRLRNFDRLPNFFIAGAPKTGSTSLYRYLCQHPQIYMSPVKEPNYFSSEVRPAAFHPEFRRAAEAGAENLRRFLNHPVPGVPHPQGIVRERKDYLKLFQGAAGEIAVGEASVCYLWSATAAANIREAVPDARIITILRDPVERAFSQYLHNARDGVVRGSFGKQIELAVSNTRREFQPLYPFLENGLYYAQVRRYLDLFPRENIRIYIYEEAWKAPAVLLADISKFLGVDPSFQPDLSFKELERRAPRSLTAHYLLRKTGAGARLRALLPNGSLPDALRSGARAMLFKPRGSAAMDARDRQTLRDYYREDVGKLAALLGREFGNWLRP